MSNPLPRPYFSCEELYTEKDGIIIPKWKRSCTCQKINELSPEEMEKVEKYMKKDGKYSNTYLAKDESLSEVYHEDHDTLDKLGITYDQIADILQTMVDKYKRKLWITTGGNWHDDSFAIFDQNKKELHQKELDTLPEHIKNLLVNNGYKEDGRMNNYNPVIIEERYLITRRSYWGFDPCPFICLCGTVSNDIGGGDDYWIYDLIINQRLMFNDLLIHLIRDHHFFEGQGFHRLDPDNVIDFFNLKPEVNYGGKYDYIERYVRIDEGGDISPCRIKGNETKIYISYGMCKFYDDDSYVNYVNIKILQINDNEKFHDIDVDGIIIRLRLNQRVETKYIKCLRREIHMNDKVINC